MITIFNFSSDNSSKSSRKSDLVIVKFAEVSKGRKLSRIEKQHYINKYVKIVRKGAHFTIYMLLGLFWLSLVKEFRVLDIKSIVFVALVCLLYAISDEVHQLFVSGRSGQVSDVIIDFLGSGCGICIYYIFSMLRRKVHE